MNGPTLTVKSEEILTFISGGFYVVLDACSLCLHIVCLLDTINKQAHWEFQSQLTQTDPVVFPKYDQYVVYQYPKWEHWCGKSSCGLKVILKPYSGMANYTRRGCDAEGCTFMI